MIISQLELGPPMVYLAYHANEPIERETSFSNKATLSQSDLIWMFFFLKTKQTRLYFNVVVLKTVWLLISIMANKYSYPSWSLSHLWFILHTTPNEPIERETLFSNKVTLSQSDFIRMFFESETNSPLLQHCSFRNNMVTDLDHD